MLVGDIFMYERSASEWEQASALLSKRGGQGKSQVKAYKQTHGPGSQRLTSEAQESLMLQDAGATAEADVGLSVPASLPHLALHSSPIQYNTHERSTSSRTSPPSNKPPSETPSEPSTSHKQGPSLISSCLPPARALTWNQAHRSLPGPNPPMAQLPILSRT